MADTFSIDLAAVEGIVTQLQGLIKEISDEKERLDNLPTRMEEEGLEGPAHDEYWQNHLQLDITMAGTAVMIDKTISCLNRTVQTIIRNEKNLSGQYGSDQP